VADKLTPLLTAALARAAAAPSGTPLFAAKADPGLFPNTAAGKAAAARATADGLLASAGSVHQGKQSREVYAATDAGLAYLLDHASPKQVLEDFVRVLERQDGLVSDLAAAAGKLADTLGGLREAVARVLPRVVAASLPSPVGGEGPGVRGHDPRPLPSHRNGVTSFLTPNPCPPTGEGNPMSNGTAAMPATAVAPTAVADRADDLAAAVLTRLTDWAASAAAGQDCPLPDLYRSLSVREHPPTVGAFHDCLRALHADRRVYLHPWTGPLYALPEPAYALLVGHNIAYYASAR
jgi:hypothetical protein